MTMAQIRWLFNSPSVTCSSSFLLNYRRLNHHQPPYFSTHPPCCKRSDKEMASVDKNPDQINPTHPSSSSISSSSDPWKERILIPSLLGVAGGAVGLISKHRKVQGLSTMSATYASNFAIVTGSYCGAREFVRVSRTGKPDDLLNSVIGGFGSRAILGRLQDGQIGAVRYSVIFAVVGTAVDCATLKIMPAISKLKEKDYWFRLPEWSPIQVHDDEAVAAKHAQEQQIYRNVHNLNKEES